MHLLSGRCEYDYSKARGVATYAQRVAAKALVDGALRLIGDGHRGARVASLRPEVGCELVGPERTKQYSASQIVSQEQIDWCVNKRDEFSPDLAINGCTASIQSGRWSGKDLSWAFSNRCSAYNKQKKSDLAMVDCDQAIRLDPTSAGAFNNRGIAHA